MIILKEKTQQELNLDVTTLSKNSCKLVYCKCPICELENIRKFRDTKFNSCKKCNNKIIAINSIDKRKLKLIEWYKNNPHHLLGTNRPQHVKDAIGKIAKNRIKSDKEKENLRVRMLGNNFNSFKTKFTPRLTTKKFIERSNIKHHNKYDYSKVKYILGVQKVDIICKKHGLFKQQAQSHLQGYGCSKCSFSKGELLILKWLDEKNINYISQYKFKDCKNKLPLPFDFYIEKLNLCIEFDGILHFKDKKINNLEKTKHNDLIKTSYCKEKNINLLRITYLEIKNIEQILNNKIYGS